MKVVVTGAGNQHGQAIVDALLEDGHELRLFGGHGEDAARWGEKVQWHAGHVATIGSIEPVLSEREVLVHAACFDAPAAGRKGKAAHAKMILQGTMGCRYGAERELLEYFIMVAPAGGGAFRQVIQEAVAFAKGCRNVPTTIIEASLPEQSASQVRRAIAALQPLGRYPGRETDAVTA